MTKDNAIFILEQVREDIKDIIIKASDMDYDTKIDNIRNINTAFIMAIDALR